MSQENQNVLRVFRTKSEAKKGIADKVELMCGDALTMPYEKEKFDAVFMSFSLELFDTPEIPKVLGEIKRVLKPEGRLVVVSMSKDGKNTLMLKLYEWAHEKFPEYADCRPIYPEKFLSEAGFLIKHKEVLSSFGLPMEIVVGNKAG